MSQEKRSIKRTLIVMSIILPIIIWLVMFSIQKHNASGQRSQQCQVDCSKKGNSGYEFKWDIFSGPVCACIP